MIRIAIPMFFDKVRVYLGKDDIKGFNAYAKKLGCTQLDEGDLGSLAGSNACWIHDAGDTLTIIHELHHVAHYMAKYRDIKDEEFEAYLQEYLFKKVMEKIGAGKGKKK